MIYVNDENFRMNAPCVVTFGKFDGLHKGHRILLEKTVELAKSYGIKSMLCTFDMRGWRKAPPLAKKLTTTEERLRLCEQMGLDYFYECPFSDEMAATMPCDFLAQFVATRLQAKAVVVGKDWRFGRNREGDVNLLTAYAKQYGYEAYALDKVSCEGREISSSWIRKEVEAGNMEQAHKLMGRPFSFRGRVAHGKQLGRTISFPTVNLLPAQDKLLVPFGVYDSTVQVGAQLYYGITNVGMRPTVSKENSVSVETYILDFSGDLYGMEIEVGLLHYERAEQTFAGVEELKKQLKKDVLQARNYWMLHKKEEEK